MHLKQDKKSLLKNTQKLLKWNHPFWNKSVQHVHFLQHQQLRKSASTSIVCVLKLTLVHFFHSGNTCRLHNRLSQVQLRNAWGFSWTKVSKNTNNSKQSSFNSWFILPYSEFPGNYLLRLCCCCLLLTKLRTHQESSLLNFFLIVPIFPEGMAAIELLL